MSLLATSVRKGTLTALTSTPMTLKEYTIIVLIPATRRVTSTVQYRAISALPGLSASRSRRALFYGMHCIYLYHANIDSCTLVPGSDERKIHKSISVGADCIVYDLEDSVSLNKKGTARHMVIDALEVINQKQSNPKDISDTS